MLQGWRDSEQINCIKERRYRPLRREKREVNKWRTVYLEQDTEDSPLQGVGA